MMKTMVTFLCGMVAAYIAFNADTHTFQAMVIIALVWIYSEVA